VLVGPPLEELLDEELLDEPLVELLGGGDGTPASATGAVEWLWSLCPGAGAISPP
jgi:hypothetical protein